MDQNVECNTPSCFWSFYGTIPWVLWENLEGPSKVARGAVNGSLIQFSFDFGRCPNTAQNKPLKTPKASTQVHTCKLVTEYTKEIPENWSEKTGSQNNKRSNETDKNTPWRGTHWTKPAWPVLLLPTAARPNWPPRKMGWPVLQATYLRKNSWKSGIGSKTILNDFKLCKGVS